MIVVQKQDKKISVFSTYSTDKIIKDGRVTTNTGGPLFFIEKALENCSVPYVSHHGETVNVEIKVNKDGEVGRVIGIQNKTKKVEDLNAKFLLISTIFNEWNLQKIGKSKAKIFVDIQGFVRGVNKFGAKVVWEDSIKYSKQVYCLKGTEEEMNYLPKNVYEDQKNRLLVITKGKKGVEWYLKGKKYLALIPREIKSPNAVGAGDTFFGYFVANIYKGKGIKFSIDNAISKTSEFLESKNY